MSDLIIVAYRQADAAFAAGAAMAELLTSAGVEPEDIVVVVRSEAESVTVNHLIDRQTGATLAGGEWGMVLGLICLGMAPNAGSGSRMTKKLHHFGLDADFLDEVAQALAGGGAVMGMRRRFLALPQIIERIARLPGEGRLIRSQLSPDAEENLLDLLDQIPSEVLEQVRSDA